MPRMTYGALASTELLAECKFEEALAQASKEIAAQPHEPEAYFNRGQALAGLGRFLEAAAAHERALSLDAGASGWAPAAPADGLFCALPTVPMALKDGPADAVAALGRYRQIRPAGRHIEDLKTWSDHI